MTGGMGNGTQSEGSKQPPRFRWLRHKGRGRSQHRERGGFWSHSLAARLIVLILLALVISHAVGFTVLLDERRLAIRESIRNLVADRITAVTRLVESTTPDLHGNVLAAATTKDLIFQIDDDAAVPLQDSGSRIEEVMRRRLAEYLDRPSDDIRFAFRRDWAKDRSLFAPDWAHHGDRDDDDDHDWDRKKGGPGIGLRASVRLRDGKWLNVTSMLRTPPHSWGGPGVISFLVSSVAIIIIVTWMVRRTMRPLRDLTAAATAVGRGDRPPPVKETGPRDIRNLIAAFNTMRDRVDRFVNDRMHMLAALSHDLRTPLTTLRLRAELMEEGEDRERFIATLEELQAMTEEVLAFIRSESETEAVIATDINGLASAVVAEKTMSDTSIDLTTAPDLPPVLCRPIAVKRALRNLVDNADRYGNSVSVHLRKQGDFAAIVVQDDGPGMSPEDLERAFEPFVRLDPARGAETGGVGLGLSICRSIARSHGGDVRIENRPEGGLRAEITLPL